MATLREVEERDSKGNTIRLNPSITYKQDQNIRVIIGRHDWRLDPNPNYHPPITAQVQGDKVYFFLGQPDSSLTRAAAKEISADEVLKVAPYIIAELKARPIKVRMPRPTVYEVKIATVGDVEVTQLEELEHDGESVEVTPVAPDLTGAAQRRRSGASHARQDAVTA